MRHVMWMFFRAEGTRPGIVFACLLLGALAQGVGLASMLPVVSVVLGGETGAEGNPDGATKLVLDALTWIGLPQNVYLLLAFAVGAIVLKNALTMMAMTYVGYSVAQIATGLRRRFIERLIQVRWSYLVDQPIGEIANALSNEANRASTAYLAAANFMVHSLRAIIYIVLAFVVSWQISTVALIGGAGIALAMRYVIRRARKAGRQQTHYAAIFGRALVDMLSNVKPLKAMGRQAHAAGLLERSTKRLHKAMRRQVVANHALKNGNEALAAILMGIGLATAIGIWQVPGPELVVLAVVLVQLVGAINKVQSEYQKAVTFESAYDAIIKMIEDVSQQREPQGGSEVPVFEQACRLVDVAFSHPGRPVLNGVTLEFPKNQTTVLTGPSGSGKTTVADLVLGFILPDRGQVLIDGRPLSDLSLSAWRQRVGYVPQELTLFNETIFDNITLGDPSLDEDDVRAALRVAGALEFVEQMPEGLYTPVGERGARLSGGQRQRIALARAVVVKPDLLILDEVTSALDPSTEQEIIENIRALQGSTTIIAITHRVALLDVADQVYRLQDGRLVAEPAGAQVPAKDVV